MSSKLTSAVLLAGSLTACQPSQPQQVVEFAPFILKSEVSEEMLLEASATLQEEFLKEQPGFVRRELARKSEREYVDIVYWNCQQDADKAAENAMHSPACLSYFQLMEDVDQDDANASITHYQVVSGY